MTETYPWTPSSGPWRSWDTPGPPGLFWRGDWHASFIYESGCVVYCNGEVWVALRNNIAVQPGSNPDLWESLVSLTGGLNIQGALADLTELPAEGRPGQAWIVDGHLVTWTDGEWFDAGTIQGPPGPQGQPGHRGAPGPRGHGVPAQGDPGTVLTRTNGRDDFATAWTSPIPVWHPLGCDNRWHPHDGPPDRWGHDYQPPAYTVDLTGRVLLRGVCQHDGPIPPGTAPVIARLPDGHRPGHAEMFGDVTVEPDGRLTYTGTDTTVSLSGIAFPAEL